MWRQPRGVRKTDRLMSAMRFDWPLLLTTVATLATTALFALVPQLDVDAAAAFYDPPRFIGRTPAGEAARAAFYVAPFAILAAALGLWLAGRLGVTRRRVSGAAAAWLVVTMALGPGLVVNLVFKDNSHRPRPAQTTLFGGKSEFRPVGRFDGACRTNCSFVSGEAAAAAWTLAPALLVPPPYRAAAVTASMVFAAATGLLRMSFGGHFLSDALLGVLVTVLIVLATRPLFLRRPPPSL